MKADAIRKVVIVGGGTAGWMSAAYLTRMLGPGLSVTLVESDEIGTVGVGEATIPPIRLFNDALRLDEADFIRETRGTFKLGIRFEGWGKPGEGYIHAFGGIGMPLGVTPFHHYWLRARSEGWAGPLASYSLNAQAAAAMRYGPMQTVPGTRLDGTIPAFHFDAGLYAAFLRRVSEAAGVTRIEGRVVDHDRDAETGHVTAISLEDGRRAEGELFIDCSGFRGLLIGQAMDSGYEDWSRFLPVDRAVAAPCEMAPDGFTPFTRASARQAGWQWRIPLQHRVGNGHVFCSDFMGEDEARDVLVANLEGKLLGEPRVLKFKTGRRAEFWKGNVVAVGLSAGFMEPLESTSIHLIQSAIVRLVSLFPDAGFAPSLAATFNRQTATEYERIRDFLILHYVANGRVGEPFWDAMRSMEVPDSLSAKLALFRETGRLFREQDELFQEEGWLQVMVGQGVLPERWAPAADGLSAEQLKGFLSDVQSVIGRAVSSLPMHRDYVMRNYATAGVGTAQ